MVRVHGTHKALAMTTDCTPRYCYADPYEGGKQAIAEAYRNLCAVGAKPLAVTNCLNFGNPQRPEIMAQIVGCLRGMSEACIALDMPIVSGNVSLYNESKATGGGSAILPTPAIGAVGILDDWEKSATIGFKAEDDLLFVLSGGALSPKIDCEGHLGQSLWLKKSGKRSGQLPCRRLGNRASALASLSGDAVTRALRFGSRCIRRWHPRCCSGNGTRRRILASQLAAIRLDAPDLLFGEDQGRYLIETAASERLIDEASRADLVVECLGRLDGDRRCSMMTGRTRYVD